MVLTETDSIFNYWNQEKVSQWLNQKGWGHFVPAFQNYHICHERFLYITLAELVEYLPRAMTTYYERRRLLKEIRLLLPNHLQQNSTPTTPNNISINTSYLYEQKLPTSDQTIQDSGLGYYSPGTSSSPSPSPTNTKEIRKKTNPPFIPARISATPEKVSKFLMNWNTKQPHFMKKPADQKIQITKDTETWYSLNVTNMRDPLDIKHHILNRLNFVGNTDHFQFFHENGSQPNKPLDPQELTYLCSIADHYAVQRILVRQVKQVIQKQKIYSPNRSPPIYTPLRRKQAIMDRSSAPATIGIQLSDPSPNQQQLWAVSPKKKPPEATKKVDFWGERPPAQVVFKHMEHYFDSQDLDKQVMVTPRKKLKSIRVVAREASQKYDNKMLRRKSTKLWGQKVVRINSRLARLPSMSEHLDNVQWIRGKLIGKGSFGRVYLAFSVGTGEVMAVKQVEIPKTASDLLNEQQHDMVEALYKEIMTLRDLDHENIVQYLGYGKDESEGVIHIFLEYVSGGSVASRLTLHGAFDEPLTKYLTRQICSGLEYLHSKHILHRDIKAANILVEVDGTCKISDFGLSKKNDYDEVYDENSRMSLRGSIYWMAPEVVKNEPYSAKVDIWSLGCTVIEMLTGQRPWLDLNQIAALYNLGRLNSPTIPQHISNEAKDFLNQCFIIDPLKRPTASDLLKHEFLQLDNTFQFEDYVDKGMI